MAYSCHEAAQYPADLLEGGVGREDDGRGAPASTGAKKKRALAAEVCCHLETAAVAFARDNLEFFGRQR